MSTNPLYDRQKSEMDISNIDIMVFLKSCGFQHDGYYRKNAPDSKFQSAYAVDECVRMIKKQDRPYVTSAVIFVEQDYRSYSNGDTLTKTTLYFGPLNERSGFVYEKAVNLVYDSHTIAKSLKTFNYHDADALHAFMKKGPDDGFTKQFIAFAKGPERKPKSLWQKLFS